MQVRLSCILQESETLAAEFSGLMTWGAHPVFGSASTIDIVCQELRKEIMELRQMADLILCCSLGGSLYPWLY